MSGSTVAPESATRLPVKPGMLEIIHFNDVYEMEERTMEPVAGVARFIALINRLKGMSMDPASRGMTSAASGGGSDDANDTVNVVMTGAAGAVANDKGPMVLFSGDVFAPSILSTITKGKHMIPFLNRMHIQAACIGNHDFDFGIDTLESHIKSTNFPWLMSNACDKRTGLGLAHGLRKHIVTWNGYRIGLIGLIEKEWLETLSTISPEQVRYVDYVQEGRLLATELREQDGVDFVFALTHMRLPSDERLATEVSGIDIIFGGHDHSDVICKVNKTWIVKSGTDFRQLSHLKMTIDSNRSFELSWERIEVMSSIAPDPEASMLVAEYAKLIAGRKLNRLIGRVKTPLDGRFAIIRTEESNLSNWIADIVKDAMKCDVALINSGTLRIDDMIPAGDITMRTLVLMLPMTDELVVIGLTGALLLDALENGVSAYPRQEGRFPMVSGVRFQFHASAPPGSRVVRETVTVNGKPLDLGREYSVATKSYLAKGKDGYTCFPQGRVIVGDDEASILPNIVRNRFLMMNAVEAFRTAETAEHKAQDLICSFLRRRSMKKIKGGVESDPQAHRLLHSHSHKHSRDLDAAQDGRITKRSKSDQGGTLISSTPSPTPTPTPTPPPPVTLTAEHDGVSSSSPSQDNLVSRRRRVSVDDMAFLDSDSETDSADCYELSAHKDGRITRLDA